MLFELTVVCCVTVHGTYGEDVLELVVLPSSSSGRDAIEAASAQAQQLLEGPVSQNVTSGGSFSPDESTRWVIQLDQHHLLTTVEMPITETGKLTDAILCTPVG